MANSDLRGGSYLLILSVVWIHLVVRGPIHLLLHCLGLVLVGSLVILVTLGSRSLVGVL